MDLCWILHFSILIYANIFNGTEICKSFSIYGQFTGNYTDDGRSCAQRRQERRFLRSLRARWIWRSTVRTEMSRASDISLDDIPL